MKIIVFGAGGEVGCRIVEEALMRGHRVTAVVRREVQIDRLPRSVIARVADVRKTRQVSRLMAGHELAISALRPPEGEEEALVPLTGSLLDAAAWARVPVLIVGGAASLEMPGGAGTTVLATPGFLPETVLPIAKASFAQFELCQAETRTDWSYLCPPAMLIPGTRTGRYRLGSDSLLFDPDGQSQISMEDFAVALLDEAERPKHMGARFTVAY